MDSVQPTHNEEHWAQLKEAGTIKGMRLLLGVYKLLGRRVFSLLMFPVAAYFVLFRKVAREASLDYLLHLYEFAPSTFKRKPGYWQVLLHFKVFAEAILDKLLAWFEDIPEEAFVLSNPELIDELLADERGQLIIGTHFGNLEYCRGFMHRNRDKVINILIYDKHSVNFARIMESVNDDSRINIFQVDEFDVPTILLLREKVARGEWVFIAGDRVPLDGLERTINVPFMGKSAAFPMGPYFLAKALACPVKLMFGYRHPKLSGDQLRFDVVDFADKIDFRHANREEVLEGYAKVFAKTLENHCTQAPYQWFNFYPFWLETYDRKH